MANNRMYIKCKTCGEEYFIAKYYPSDGWFSYGIDEDDFSRWLEGHNHELKDFSVWGGYQFQLSYEIPKRRRNE